MKKELWFSLYDFSFNYQGEEAAFIEESMEWCLDFQNAFASIKEELKNYLKSKQTEAYFNQSMVNKNQVWKTVSLKWWGIEFFKKQKDFPVTSSILKKHPNLLSLSFNLLEAGGHILPHCGDTNGIYRSHFGLEVPGQLPEVGFKVKNEMRNWVEGEWLIFMDAFQHEAFNKSEKDRIIMVVDYLRPEFQLNRRKIISVVLTSLFLQKRAQRFKFLQKSSAQTVKFISFLLRPMAYISMKFCNAMRIY